MDSRVRSRQRTRSTAVATPDRPPGYVAYGEASSTSACSYALSSSPPEAVAGTGWPPSASSEVSSFGSDGGSRVETQYCNADACSGLQPGQAAKQPSVSLARSGSLLIQVSTRLTDPHDRVLDRDPFPLPLIFGPRRLERAHLERKEVNVVLVRRNQTLPSRVGDGVSSERPRTARLYAQSLLLRNRGYLPERVSSCGGCQNKRIIFQEQGRLTSSNASRRQAAERSSPTSTPPFGICKSKDVPIVSYRQEYEEGYWDFEMTYSPPSLLLLDRW